MNARQLRQYQQRSPYNCYIGKNMSHLWCVRATFASRWLHCANLYGADLRGANLTNADFTDADLTNADLTNANLRGALMY